MHLPSSSGAAMRQLYCCCYCYREQVKAGVIITACHTKYQLLDAGSVEVVP